jgi:hypothetical protein
MTSRRYTYILATLLIAVTVGCIKIRYVTLPAKTVEQVELLPGPPDKPFKVVGHVFIDGSNKRGWQSIAEQPGKRRRIWAPMSSLWGTWGSINLE